MEVRGLSDLETAKKVGHEAFIDAVEAEIEGIVAARRRSDGVGAGDELMFASRLADGDELPGDKVKRRQLLDLEFKVLGLLRKIDGAGEPGGEQGLFHFSP